MTITPAMARDLAVTYSAYLRAVDAKDHDGIKIWAPLLLKAQGACDTDLLSPGIVTLMVRLSDDLIANSSNGNFAE